VGTIIDAPGYSANELYRIDETDPVEGAWSGASFGGAGVENQPHIQLANRTAFLKGRQDANIAAIAPLQAWAAEFTSDLEAIAPPVGVGAPALPGVASGGWFKVPIVDTSMGALVAIVQFGWYSFGGTQDFGGQASDPKDTAYTIAWPIAFPNAILAPPIAVNVYVATGGSNLEIAARTWSASGATFEVDTQKELTIAMGGLAPEQSAGFGFLAIGF